MHWLCKCVFGLVVLATTTWSATLAGAVSQKCVPPGLGLSLNDSFSGKSYLYKQQQEFSIKLLQTLVTDSSKENFIFSPHSIYMALLITYLTSNDGNEEKNLKRFLNLPPEQGKLNVMQGYRMDKLFLSMRALNTSTDYEFSSVEGIFVSPGRHIEECIAEVLKDEVHRIDFTVNPELARKYINNWVSNHTNQMILGIFPEGIINCRTILVLANAAYFKGYWNSGFDSTVNDIFYTSPSENKYVPMMSRTSEFNIKVSSELDSHVIELPYKGGDINMYVILPRLNEEHGISQLSKRLSTKTIQNIVSSSGWGWIYAKVSLPKFKAKHTIYNLKEKLLQMGLRETNIKNVVHKAVISVDEKGTTAAAATGVKTIPMILRRPLKLSCNHPFIYFLFHKVTGSVMFMGVYNSPISN